MKFARCVMVFWCFLPIPAWADAEKAIEACRTVYEGATANITAFAQQIIQYERLHEAMCDGKNVKTNFNLSSGMDVVLNNLPIGGFLNISAGKDKKTQFCSNFDKEIFSSDNLNGFEKRVSVEALNSFNSCMEISISEDVTIDSKNIARNYTEISFDKKNNNPIKVRSINFSSNLVCSLNVGAQENPLVISPGYGFTTSEDFGVLCVRRPEKLGDVTRYDEGFISLQTSNSKGIYSILIPPDEDLPYLSALKAKEEIDSLTAQRDDWRSKFDEKSEEFDAIRKDFENHDEYDVWVLQAPADLMLGWMKKPHYHFQGCRADPGISSAFGNDYFVNSPCVAGYEKKGKPQALLSKPGTVGCPIVLRAISCVRQ